MSVELPPGPAFHGPRFDEGEFPLDCLEELIAYRHLVKLAADEWAVRQNLGPSHPSRDVAITVATFDQKCCRPRLRVTRAHDSELLPLAPVRVWVEQANEALARTIRGEYDQVSEPLLRGVSRMGRKLRKEDWINIDGSETPQAARAYTAQTREMVQSYLKKQLVPDRRTFLGIVVGAKDRSKSCEIDILTLDGQRISGAVRSAEDHRTAREAYSFNKEERPLVRVIVVGLFIGKTAKKVDQLEDVRTLAGPEVQSRLSAIEALPEGWDGEGAPAISFARTDEARRILTRLLAKLDRTPAVAPGPNGELVLEWSLRDEPRLSLGILLNDEPGLWIYGIGVSGIGRRVAGPDEFLESLGKVGPQVKRLPASPPAPLLRRVLETQLDEHSRPTLAAFLPRPRDRAKLSVYLADRVTPDEAVKMGSARFTYGVAGITTADVAAVGALVPAADLHVVPDSPPHCFVDFTRASMDECCTLAAALAGVATPPPPWSAFRQPPPAT